MFPVNCANALVGTVCRAICGPGFVGRANTTCTTSGWAAVVGSCNPQGGHRTKAAWRRSVLVAELTLRSQWLLALPLLLPVSPDLRCL
jgi:hypothetical protein